MTPPKITGHRVSFPEQRLLVYARALRIWGPARQISKALEEILEAGLELQRAIQNPLSWIAPGPGKGEVDMKFNASEDLVSEVADLLIMAEQLRLIVGPARVDHAASVKIDRTSARLLKLELETAAPEPPEVKFAGRGCVFDNPRTWRRETYWNGELTMSTSAQAILQARKGPNFKPWTSGQILGDPRAMEAPTQDNEAPLIAEDGNEVHLPQRGPGSLGEEFNPESIANIKETLATMPGPSGTPILHLSGTRLPGPPPRVDFGKLASGASALLSAPLAWGTPPQVEPGPEEGGGPCQKVPHGPEGGYLHAEEDDGPYSVDGVEYCGRCHRLAPCGRRVPSQGIRE